MFDHIIPKISSVMDERSDGQTRRHYSFIYYIDIVYRQVSLHRDASGSLGLSIKGGREHNLPILVSRVTSTDLAARDIYIGDAILRVNTQVSNKDTHG